MAVSIEAIYAALPETMADEGEFDAVLRRVGRVADYDGAKLGALRTIVYHNKLVVRALDGQLVKGELPKAQSFAEAENERIAQVVARQRRQRELLTPDENYVNPQRVQTEQFIQQVVGERFAALEEQMADLQQQVEALQSQDVAA